MTQAMTREEMIRAAMAQGWDRRKAERAADLEMGLRQASKLYEQRAACIVEPPIQESRVRRPRKMNKTEGIRAAQLQRLADLGEIQWFGYELVKLAYGDGLYYTPDFTVMWTGMPGEDWNHRLEFEEVKGSQFHEAARVRIKLAAQQFPWWTFRSYQRREKFNVFAATPRWYIEEFRAAGAL